MWQETLPYSYGKKLFHCVGRCCKRYYYSVASATQEQMAPMTGVTLKSSSLLKYWTSLTPSVSGPPRLGYLALLLECPCCYNTLKVMIDRAPPQ